MNQIAETICNSVTKAQCLWEWDNVNDPPCHPSDEDWKGCSSCYANRETLAVAFRAAANHLRPHPSRTPWIGPNGESLYFNETFENFETLGEMSIVEKLGQIASGLNPKISGGGVAPDQGRAPQAIPGPNPNPSRPSTVMTTPIPFTTRLPNPENDCMSPFMEVWVFCDDGFLELMRYDSSNLEFGPRSQYGLTHWLPYDKIPHPLNND